MNKQLFTDSRYYDWLNEQYLCHPLLENCQYILIRMFNTPYEAMNELDESRAVDGFDIRMAYADECGMTGCDHLQGQVSVLEVLIALALHMNDMTDGFVSDPSVGYWIWRIITNLNLDVYGDDIVPNFQSPDDDVRKILTDAMTQNYDAFGHGSFFPLKHKHHRQDSRQLDLWYQMNFWLVENVKFS